MYILDDPLSAVDTVVGRRLFETCLTGVLRNSVVVLVTHQLQYAQLANTMLVLDRVSTSEQHAPGASDSLCLPTVLRASVLCAAPTTK